MIDSTTLSPSSRTISPLHQANGRLDAEASSSRPAPTRWTGGQKLLLCVVLGLGLVVSFFQLGSFRTLTSHEAYLAVSTREMLASGDWIVPRFGGLPRLTKPPLGYWSAAVCTVVCGGQPTEFTMRLPSALSGLALVALVGWWAGRWYGRSAGLCAALIQGTSLFHLLHAREATVDMLQCFLMTLAMALAGLQPVDESPWKARARWLGIYSLLGILALAKFHFGPVLVVAPLVMFWLAQRQWRSFCNVCHPLGVVIFLGLALVWPALILQRLPEAYSIWQHETVGRALGEMTPEPWWFFLPATFYLMLPWAVLIPLMVPESWRRVREADPRDRFLWTWIIVQVVLLSLSSNKHRNYLIPALPAVAMLLGPTLWRCREWKFKAPVWAPCLTSGLVAIAAAIAVWLLGRKLPAMSGATTALICLAGVGATAVIWLSHYRRWRATAVVGGMAYAACLCIINLWITAGQDFRAPAVEFVRRVRQDYPTKPLHVYHMGQSPVVFYLGLPAQRSESAAELQAELRQTPELHVLGIRPHVDGLRALADVAVLDSLPPGHPNTTNRTDDLVFLRVRARR